MKSFTKLLLGVLCLLMSTQVYSSILNINFNGDEFLLGSFESAETGASFYRYGSPSAASANPVYPGTSTLLPLEADALHIFSHLNSLTNELSFGLILEKPNGSGGGTFSATVAWSVPALFAFADDPGETGVIGSAGPLDISLAWVDCCTDGFVISGFNPTDLFLNLTNVGGSDLTKVIFLSPDRNNTRFDFPTNQFNISIQSCNPQTDPNGCVISTIPEPATWSLLLLAVIRAFRRKCI
jgi:hypothetical protein